MANTKFALKIMFVKRYSILPIAFLWHFAMPVAAQHPNVKPVSSKETTKGEVKVIMDTKIASAISRLRKGTKTTRETIDGYRVQIFSMSGNDARNEAERVKKDFDKRFPDVRSNLTYLQPNFKIRCGDFRTKAEAKGFINDISRYYPGAYIVRDKIKVITLD
jgi:hypothetical protein